MLTSDRGFVDHAIDDMRTPAGKAAKAAVRTYAELNNAVAAGDEAAIKAAADRVTDANLELVTRVDRWPDAPLFDRDVAAALLAGRGTDLAPELRARLVDVDDEQRHLADVPEAEWWVGLTLTRVRLRILERDWTPIEDPPKRKYLGNWDRRYVMRRVELLAAFAQRDVARAKRLSAAIRRERDAESKLFAWALTREARALGIELPIRSLGAATAGYS